MARKEVDGLGSGCCMGNRVGFAITTMTRIPSRKQEMYG